MTTIYVKVTLADAHARVDGYLTAGMVGVPVVFEFGPEWNRLKKTAVFTAGDVTRGRVDIVDHTTVPAEVLAMASRRLRVGVYGYTDDGTIVIPTIMADAGMILPGAKPSDDPGTNPELPIWAQLQAEIDALRQNGAVTDEQISAAIEKYLSENPDDGVTYQQLYDVVAAYMAENPAQSGEDGGYYTVAVTQPDAKTAAFDFTPSKEGMALVPQRTVTLPAGPQGPAGTNGLNGKDGVIALTGAKVGDIARVSAVDDNGVPTAWEPVDLPSGEEWVELVNVTLEENSIPILDLGDYAVNFKKLRFFIRAEAMTPVTVIFALSIPNALTGLAYNLCTINNFGDASATSRAIIEFEPLIEEAFCRVSYSWVVAPTTNVKTSNFSYQYNSYDYSRLETARYFRPNQELPAGTTILIKGVKK